MGAPRLVEFAHTLLRARDWQDRPELEQLRAWWRERGHGGAGVFALVGIGGAGKTAIADRFLREVPGVFPRHPEVKHDPSLPQPAKLFVFSFYDVPNPQVFLAQVLDWLDDRAPDQGRQRPHYTEIKARLKDEDGLLLVLDGLEKVQDDGARGGRLGHITDASLRQLLLDLGEGYLPGVSAIITTRFLLDDLEVAEGPYYRAIDVERIAVPSCIELLRRRGVHGADTALEAIAEACGQHALTVDLIGGYLAAFKGGAPLLEDLPSHEDIARIAADEPDRKRQAVARQSARFSRMAQRYREGLREHDPIALALMERICLFRTGVTVETLAAIFLGKGKETVAGKELSQLTLTELKMNVYRLSEMGIIEYAEDASGQRRIQVHPAVREGFLTGLAADNASHNAIRAHLASTLVRTDVTLGNKPDSTPRDPATQDLIEEMIHHSLEAGLVMEAYELFEDRLATLSLLGGHERTERVCRLFSKGRSPSRAHLHEDWKEGFFLIWGVAYQAMGQPALARVCYERYLLENLRDPDETDVPRTLVLAFALLAEGQLSRAAQQFRHLLKARGSELAVSLIRLVSAFLDGGLLDKHARGFIRKWKRCDDNDEILRFAVFARADLLVHLLVRAELIEAAELVAEKSLAAEGSDLAGRELPMLHLAAAQVGLAESRWVDAEKELGLAEQWSAAHDSPEVACAAALVRGQLHLARARTTSRPDAEQLNPALKAASDGVRIARRAGYGFHHLELLLLRARIQLWRGDAHGAAEDARAALYGLDAAPPGKSRFDALPLDERAPADRRGIFGEGRPPLYAATHPECNYVWGEADGRYLLGEALALAAAADSDAAMAQDAVAELEKACTLQRRIGDPHIVETEAALARIASGAPSPFPLPVRKAQLAKPAAPQPAPLMFVCYAHADNEPPHRWLDRLLEMIEPLNRRGVVRTWSDHAIDIGERWDAEIQRSLATARAAVLLISPAFLASKYIHSSELPVLLRRAQDERSLRILPVLLRPSLFRELTFRYPDPAHGPDDVKLADFQVANPPSLTLSEMTQPEQDRVLLGVARALLELAAS